MAEHTTITVEAHEVEGLAYYVDIQLNNIGEELGAAADRRAFLDYIRDPLDIEEALTSAERKGGPAALALSCDATVRGLIRGGGSWAPELIGDGLAGKSTEPEADVRRGKGLISLAQRFGVYEGVAL